MNADESTSRKDLSSSKGSSRQKAYEEPAKESNLSDAVKGVIKRLGDKGNVTAVEVARELLKYRTAYAKKKGIKKLKLLNDYLEANASTGAQRMTAEEWVDQVRELYMPDIKKFHGKLLIIGLAMLDQPLKTLLITDSFLDDLIPEVTENVVTVLSRKGKTRFDELLFDQDPEHNDQLENSDDNPLTEKESDFLDRYYFAEFVVKLLNHTSLEHGAFAVHLYAPWGAGKTSFMNFMKSAFRAEKSFDGKKQWHCVDFNAWQNQNLPYPWWIFMNNIYYELKHELPWRSRLKEWFWRFKALRLHQTIAFLVIGILLYLYGGSTMVAGSKWLENISKFLGALAAIWGLAISISQSLFNRSKIGVQSYLESKDNPISEFKKKFRKLILALKPAKLVVFIDDLDRCKSGYVVELLENIQTIFKDANVIFVIAADKKWLHASYEVEYDKIKNFILVEGKTIGPLFIEKMFQLSIALPGVPEIIKERCWAAMLKIKEKDQTSTPSSQDKREKPSVAVFNEDHSNRLKRLETLSDQTTLKQTEHFLKPYGKYLDVNPRNMKRLLNNYLVNKGATLISHIDIPKHQLILYTILNIQWPVLADYLVHNPDVLDGEEEASPEMVFLLKQQEIRAVIDGKGFDEGLQKSTLVKCSILFSFGAYFVEANP